MTKSFGRAALCGLLGLLVALPASAGGRHHRFPRASFGFQFGGPFYSPVHSPFYDPWPYYRPLPPAYYEPRTVIIERDPPVYIQREPAPTQATLWYYCPSPAGYYPHVPTCPQQWVPVDPATLPPR